MTKKNFIITTLLLFVFVINANAQYYASALGLNGTALKTALHNIIKNHQDKGWPLWSYFSSTDNRIGNKVWDIYSDIPGGTAPYLFAFNSDQCGTYTQESDCYNHEHTWPSNYFNDLQPMRTDLFHVMPTDGWVNNKRSNFPYGKVLNPIWTSDNGSKLGKTSSYTLFTSNNSNKYGFEPIDSFKGDVARNYFYMSTRYENEDAGWDNWEMANGAELTPAAITLLLQWHHLDPVSQKEITRNDSVFKIQGNRNPFIDYPEFADCIWGTGDCTALSVTSTTVKNSISVYPNPATNEIVVGCQLSDVSFQEVCVFDIVGKKYNLQISTQDLHHITLNLQTLQQGNYILHLKTNQGVINKLFSKN